MNDTLLALLGALAICGLTNFALPRSDWDGDDDPTLQVEDTADTSSSDEIRR